MGATQPGSARLGLAQPSPAPLMSSNSTVEEWSNITVTILLRN